MIKYFVITSSMLMIWFSLPAFAQGNAAKTTNIHAYDSTLQAITDTSKRINQSALNDTAYWQRLGTTANFADLHQRLQSYNQYAEAPAKNWWTLYYITVNDTLKIPFLVYIPKKYSAAKKTPLYVHLHGAVTRQNFIPPQVIPSSEEKVLQRAMAQNALIIYPFARKNLNWVYHQQAFEVILQEISFVKALYNIDDNKAYVGGHSDGARGALWFALNKRSSFAGFYGICYEPLLLNQNTPFNNLRNAGTFYGISAVHDELFNYKQVNELVQFGRRLGANWQNVAVSGTHALPYLTPDSVYFVHNSLIRQTRDVTPKKIEWETDNIQNGRCHWIGISKLDTLQAQPTVNPKLTAVSNGTAQVINIHPHRYGAVVASIEGNNVFIKTSGVKQITLYVTPGLADLSKPLLLYVNSRLPVAVTITPDKKIMLDTFLQTHDRANITIAQIDIPVL